MIIMRIIDPACNFNRRKFLQYSSIAVGANVLAIFNGKQSFAAYDHDITTDTVKVGIRYSTTGSLANIEKPLLDATLLAIEHINNGTGAWAGNGIGIDGKKIEPIVVNPNSSWEQYHRAYQHLIEDEKVDKVISYDILNEQDMQNFIAFLYQELGSTGFFVGSEHPYVKIAHAIGKEELTRLGGSVIGDEYVELDASDLGEVLRKIKSAKPD